MSELNAAQMAMLQRVDSEAEDENLDHTKHLAQEKLGFVELVMFLYGLFDDCPMVNPPFWVEIQ